MSLMTTAVDPKSPRGKPEYMSVKRYITYHLLDTWMDQATAGVIWALIGVALGMVIAVLMHRRKLYIAL